jgi:hypothetical protein
MADNIDDILKRRAVPEPATNLAERIIDAAARRKPKQSAASGFKAWLEEFLDDFALPQPALVMGTVLFAGLMLGVYAGNASAQQQGDDLSVIYIQDSFNVEEMT